MTFLLLSRIPSEPTKMGPFLPNHIVTQKSSLLINLIIPMRSKEVAFSVNLFIFSINGVLGQNPLNSFNLRKNILKEKMSVFSYDI